MTRARGRGHWAAVLAKLPPAGNPAGKATPGRFGAVVQRKGPPSVVHGCDEEPRPRRGDVLVVGCGCPPLVRPERCLSRPRIRKVQLGDPVVGLLTSVSSSDETCGLDALQT